MTLSPVQSQQGSEMSPAIEKGIRIWKEHQEVPEVEADLERPLEDAGAGHREVLARSILTAMCLALQVQGMEVLQFEVQ